MLYNSIKNKIKKSIKKSANKQKLHIVTTEFRLMNKVQ